MAVEFDFVFPLPQGLHARPAGRIQETAERFDAETVWINRRSGTEADGKSVLALIGTDTQSGDPCRIRIEGPAAEEAGIALRSLLAELPKWEDAAAEAQAAPSEDLPRILVLDSALVFRGTPAGPGIVRGLVVVDDPELEVDLDGAPLVPKPDDEIQTFFCAVDALDEELRRRVEEAKDRTERNIVEAHRSILRDRAFAARVSGIIAAERRTAADAVARAARDFCAPLRTSRSVYIRERVADIKDVSRRLIGRLSERPAAGHGIRLEAPAIVVADDMSPSRFLALNRKFLTGLVLESAGLTSHTLIMARARGIPAVSGCAGGREKLQTGEDVILDGGRGLIVPAPSPSVIRYFEVEAEAEARLRRRRRESGRLPGVTADGKRVEIAANIGDPEELAAAWDAGAEGIGLFRTELLLMGRSTAPDEDEQFAVYARLAGESGGRPIIVRTFDIGGDKPLPFLPLPAEANPFLGQRGIRLYERQADLIRAQLRALLRAAALGPLKIMLPMVSAVEEVAATRDVLRSAAAELAARGALHNAGVELGMMVEVPSAAWRIERFSDVVDFFSVGSNDLLQYFFAADRGNPAVRGLNDPADPGFLHLLRSIVREAHGRDKWVGLCGELAASVRLLPILIGLGFDELSMGVASVAGVKSRLRTLDSAACEALAEKAVALPGIGDVNRTLDEFETGSISEAPIVPSLVRLSSPSRSKVEALQELAVMMEDAGRATARADVENALWQREDTFSTGVGFGVAIPHCRTAAVRTMSVGVLRFAAPIKWDAADEEPADLAVFLAVPAAAPSMDHLKVLARLSRRIADEEFRAALRSAADDTAVIQLISAALAG